MGVYYSAKVVLLKDQCSVLAVLFVSRQIERSKGIGDQESNKNELWN